MLLQSLQSVPVTVVVIFIVATQRSQATNADGIGEEDLSSSIHPYLSGRMQEQTQIMHRFSTFRGLAGTEEVYLRIYLYE